MRVLHSPPRGNRRVDGQVLRMTRDLPPVAPCERRRDHVLRDEAARASDATRDGGAVCASRYRAVLSNVALRDRVCKQ